ncbi:hypothetical protein [Domibacillus aminovorans]|nr:hypothetical protein [Domibacillus aminovorans]
MDITALLLALLGFLAIGVGIVLLIVPAIKKRSLKPAAFIAGGGLAA